MVGIVVMVVVVIVVMGVVVVEVVVVVVRNCVGFWVRDCVGNMGRNCVEYLVSSLVALFCHLIPFCFSFFPPGIWRLNQRGLHQLIFKIAHWYSQVITLIIGNHR